jgi:hypothetical protein
MAKAPAQPRKKSAVQAEGACACGAVRFEIDVPAVWAWHDHSAASRRATGAAYSTWVGSWKSRFCGRCGTPLFYERKRSPKMINIPRALFETRTGREPRYHMYLDQQADWTWTGEALSPLKGYPGVMRERPRKKTRALPDDSLFDP